MPISKKVEVSDYYDFHPSLDHRTGDIWRDLPCLGLMRRDYVSGVVITPACDLANEKCDAITYIPIIPIGEFLNNHASYHDYWIQIKQILDKESLTRIVSIPRRFELPLACDIESAINELKSKKGSQAEQTTAYKQLIAYLKFINARTKNERLEVAELQSIISKGKFLEILHRIVKNSHRTDIHFFPSDQIASEFSVMDMHSIALFRYPMSVPIQILDEAKYSTSDAWDTRREKISEDFPMAKKFGRWPIKIAQLKGGFLSDFISRYLAMYIRLGSDDFSEQTVEQIGQNIMEGK